MNEINMNGRCHHIPYTAPMPTECAPRHPYLKLALVPNLHVHGVEIPCGAERTFLLKKANAISRGDEIPDAVFPVRQPRSFRRHQLCELEKQKLLVSLKTDGVRYLLLLTRYNGEPRAVLIDRSLAIREIEVWANDDFFDDTLMDGELVMERNNKGTTSDVFLAFDLFAVRGAQLRKSVYSDRINALFGILHTTADFVEDIDELTNAVTEGRKICAAPNTYLRIVSKVIMCSAYTEHVWNERFASPHMNDGLIFTPDVAMDAPVVVWKWKPLNTIDIMLHVSNSSRAPSILIRQANGTRVTKTVEMCQGRKLRLVLDSNVLLESLIGQGHVRFVVECACLVEGNVAFVTPIRPRLDKPEPNHIHVVRETLHNVTERMCVNEIISVMHRAAPFMPSSP